MLENIQVLKDIPNMIEALQDELKYTKRNHKVTLFNGFLESQNEGSFIYRFEIPEGTYLNMVEDVKIFLGSVPADGSIVSIENQFVLIKFNSDQGQNISQLTVEWDSGAILQKLIQRLQKIDKKPADFYVRTTNLLFYPTTPSHLSSWKMNLVLPTKTYITNPPKEFIANARQQEALKASLNNNVTYIWGPPGTGKTQTLGMIAYNLIQADKRILFASNTNRAVDIGVLSVIDRFKEHGGNIVEDITRYGQIALFSNDDLKQVVFEKQLEALKQIKQEKVREEKELLDKFQRAEDELNKFKVELLSIDDLQRKLPEKQNQLNTTLSQLKSLRSQIDTYDTAGFVQSLKRKFTGLSKEILQTKFESLQLKGRELNDDIDNINKEIVLIDNKCGGVVLKRQEYIVLDSAITKYGGKQKLSKYISDELDVKAEQIIKEKKMVGATLAKIVMNDIFWSVRYDVLLIDEASMVNLPYLVALSSLAKLKVIIIGDPLQLSPICSSQDSLTQEWLLKDIYTFISKAKDLSELFQWNELNTSFSIFLNTQYRMASDLCKIISDFFYQGRLINGINHETTNGQIVFIDSSPLHPKTETISPKPFKPNNPIHTSKIIELIKTALSISHYHASEIGIIIPFNYSAEFVREQLKINELKNIEVGTVHTFQGREKSVIIFDTVMAGVNYTVRPFDELKVGDDQVRKLLNVALSRAKKDIFIIADMNHFRSCYQGKIIYEVLQQLNEKSNQINLASGVSSFDIMSDKEKNMLLGLKN